MSLGRFTRLAPSQDPAAQVAADTFRFVFSNEKPGRDNFVVLNSAIKHANFDRNPVVLFAHDDTEPPIGRGTNIDTSGANCTIDITFVPREILPFAGTIRDLVAGKWLRAVSLSWMPVELKRSSDPDVDVIFTEVDMLEVSIVPLPSLADALLTARSSGINTRPLASWAERALEMPAYRAIPRLQLEAIHRAASSVRSTSSSSRAEREARARQLIERGERLEKALNINRGEGGMTESESDNVRAASGHLQRALRRHKELAGHHDELGEKAGELREVHRALTKTLEDLGIEDKGVSRAMKDLDRCGRAIRKSHTGAEDAADSAAGHVDKAADCVSAMPVFK
jgi:prohead serine protease